MDERKDGGPAFPQNDLSAYGMGPSEINNGGMTLRDYFAVHCDQPGEAEIVAAAGLLWDGMVVIPEMHDQFEQRMSFNQWWWDLPQARRFELYAAVRYQLADAMLAEREKGGSR